MATAPPTEPARGPDGHVIENRPSGASVGTATEFMDELLLDENGRHILDIINGSRPAAVAPEEDGPAVDTGRLSDDLTELSADTDGSESHVSACTVDSDPNRGPPTDQDLASEVDTDDEPIAIKLYNDAPRAQRAEPSITQQLSRALREKSAADNRVMELEDRLKAMTMEAHGCRARAEEVVMAHAVFKEDVIAWMTAVGVRVHELRAELKAARAEPALADSVPETPQTPVLGATPVDPTASPLKAHRPEEPPTVAKRGRPRVNNHDPPANLKLFKEPLRGVRPHMSETEVSFIELLRGENNWNRWQIAAALGRTPQGVQSYLNRVDRAEGAKPSKALAELAEHGHQRAQLKLDYRIAVALCDGDASVGRVQRNLRDITGHDYHREKVRRTLHSFGFRFKAKLRSTLMSQDHRDKRILFAQAMLKLTDSQLAQIAFSDEKIFTPGGVHSRTWAHKSDKVCMRQCRRQGQMAFLVINEHFTWQIFWYKPKERIDGERYLKVLEEYVTKDVDVFMAPEDRPEGADRTIPKVIFQEDNAAVHFAKAIVDRKKVLITTLEEAFGVKWPAKSPDLSPIENLWSWLDHKLKDARVSTLKHMRYVVERALNSTEGRRVTLSLLRSFRSRLEKVEETNGDNVQNTCPRQAGSLPAAVAYVAAQRSAVQARK